MTLHRKLIAEGLQQSDTLLGEQVYFLKATMWPKHVFTSIHKTEKLVIQQSQSQILNYLTCLHLILLRVS
jgi:hypothetical protein